MVRAAIVIGAVFTLGTGASAQTTGVAACDDFLTKYEACVTAKVPAAQRATFQGQLDQTRKTWSDLAKNASTKPALEGSCKQTSEQMKAALQNYGCAF
ncbi:hypothetical protein [Bradyrhizobium sp. LHD-71]|uniref:hypothetical protein n=1 Tax=Bradyrhizobium sp. LHD-71 TaxID=3072141 RepID=UPI00280C9F5F|nr:hypothetical protein [Bradyrhizobium sp. LHD-71]MDQ8728321.1 hypothetical protein [Bradyrhizobium sp. LHD-71]